MSCILGSIGTLNCCQPGFILPATGNAVTVFQHIYTLAQTIEKEISGSIFNHHIITYSTVPAITGKCIHRFEAGTTLIFQLNEIHGTVLTYRQTGNHFISYRQLRGSSDGLQFFLSTCQSTL